VRERTLFYGSAVKWTVHGERSLYESPWVALHLADVEVPGGERFDHHVIRSTRPAVGLVVEVDGSFLLLWRHRFITDAWGWEIPCGGVERGESLADAARRETIEETGWVPGAVTPLLGFDAMNGICDQRIEVFHASSATKGGPPTDSAESSRIDWVSREQAYAALRQGDIRDGTTATALLACHVLRP